jgi:hypothetical protein
MFRVYRTNGQRGEILAANEDGFIGFMLNLGRPDAWARPT